jgi:hypothetical protein
VLLLWDNSGFLHIIHGEHLLLLILSFHGIFQFINLWRVLSRTPPWPAASTTSSLWAAMMTARASGFIVVRA